MKITISFLIILIGFVFCSNNTEEKPALQESKLYSINPILKSTFDKVKNDFNPILINNIDLKEGEKIKIRLENDSVQIFSDTLTNTDNPVQRVYRYMGKYQEINKHLVEASYWENFYYLLIDGHDGLIDTLWSKPYFSENNSFIIARSLTFGVEGSPNGLQIWKLFNNELIKIIEINQQEWIPQDIVWESEKSLLFSFKKVEDYWSQTDSGKNYYARLTILD